MNNKTFIRKIIICCFISLCTIEARAASLPTDPNNAALLYYQAFMLHPEPDDSTEKLIRSVMHGAEPDEKIREYLKSCLTTIRTIEVASEIEECDWGIQYSQGYRYPLPQLIPARRIAFMLRADARVLAFDKSYQAAFRRCLLMRRFAQHIGDDTLHLYIISKDVDRGAQICIQRLLGSIVLDEAILTWLKNQLTANQGVSLSLLKALSMDFELALQSIRTNVKTLSWIRRKLAEGIADETTKKNVSNLTDDELIVRAREPYEKYLNSIFPVIDSNMLYADKYAGIHKLTEGLKNEYGSDPAANQVIMACAEHVLKLYSLHVGDTARLNALMLALEIYYVRAKTDKLPEILPKGLPKDPYSGKDFDYEITKDGFILRCRVKPIDEREVRQFEFKVKK